MSDPISLLALAAHANVDTVVSGQSQLLAGYEYGTIRLPLQAKGAAVDVSAYSTLRLDLVTTLMQSNKGDDNDARLMVSVEHAPSADGPWSLLHTFEPVRGDAIAHGRAVLAGFDRFVRASYFFMRWGHISDGIRDGLAVTFSLTGEALPETGE